VNGRYLTHKTPDSVAIESNQTPGDYYQIDTNFNGPSKSSAKPRKHSYYENIVGKKLPEIVHSYSEKLFVDPKSAK
jgi:hypothetical protein